MINRGLIQMKHNWILIAIASVLHVQVHPWPLLKVVETRFVEPYNSHAACWKTHTDQRYKTTNWNSSPLARKCIITFLFESPDSAAALMSSLSFGVVAIFIIASSWLKFRSLFLMFWLVFRWFPMVRWCGICVIEQNGFRKDAQILGRHGGLIG